MPARPIGTSELDIGERLKLAREGQGKSLREIAESTKISMVTLAALERNDFSRLPGGIFGRAFVRCCAQEVGLDPEPIVQELIARCPDTAPTPLEAEGDAHRPHSRLRWVLVVGLLVVLAVAAGTYVWMTTSASVRRTTPIDRGSR